jgi:hypothetical protein
MGRGGILAKKTPDGASPIRRDDNPTEESTVFWWQLSSWLALSF